MRSNQEQQTTMTNCYEYSNKIKKEQFIYNTKNKSHDGGNSKKRG